MANYKGAGLMIVKKMFARQPPDAQAAWLTRLTPEERQVYERVIATQWLPIGAVAAIFEKSAGELFPGDGRGLEKLGRQQALDHLQGIYRPLLRMLTVEFAVKQVAKLWNSYFDEGKAAAVEDPGRTWVMLTVAGYPGLPAVNRRVVSGYFQGVLELCGVPTPEIQHDADQPDLWRWKGRR